MLQGGIGELLFATGTFRPPVHTVMVTGELAGSGELLTAAFADARAAASAVGGSPVLGDGFPAAKAAAAMAAEREEGKVSGPIDEEGKPEEGSPDEGNPEAGNPGLPKPLVGTGTPPPLHRRPPRTLTTAPATAVASLTPAEAAEEAADVAEETA